MKLKPGNEYEIRSLSNPDGETIRFVILSEGHNTSKGLVFKKLSKEKVCTVSLKEFVASIPENPTKLIALTKNYYYNTRGKKLLMV